MLRFIALLALCASASCATYKNTPPHPTPAPLPPAGSEADCTAACANMRRLHCPAGNPTEKGASCEAVCINIESSGYATMSPLCVARAPSCDEADACTG